MARFGAFLCPAGIFFVGFEDGFHRAFRRSGKATVLTVKVEQGIPFANNDFFDLRDKDGVVTGVLRGLQFAFEVSEGSVQNGSTVLRAIEAGAGYLFSLVMSARGVGVVLGNTTLVCREDIYSESFFGMQVGVGFGTLVDAYQNQLGIERDGSKGIGGHALDQSFVVHGDDGDTGGEAAQSLTEFRRGNAHVPSELNHG